MLNANAADSAKLTDKIVAVLNWNGISEVDTDEGRQTTGAPHVYVRTRDLYESCKLSSLPMRFFQEEVNDILSGTAVCNKVGIWVFTEVGDGYSVFVYLGPNTKGSPGMKEVIDAQVKAKQATLVTSFDFDEDDDDEGRNERVASRSKRR